MTLYSFKLEPRLFQLNPNGLSRASQWIANREAATVTAYKRLCDEAEALLLERAESVTEKEVPPPSNDLHDYASWAPYYWPDPEKPDGLPQIRRDGDVNPEACDPRCSDARRFKVTVERVRKLALAFYFSGDERFAAHAAFLLRVFFLNPATAMNANLNYGQAIRGGVAGRRAGLIETRYLSELVDALGLLALSRSWDEKDEAGMQRWAGCFLKWLTNTPLAQRESLAHNNHGTFFDAQYATLALYLNQKSLAASVLEQAMTKRIAAQIEPGGEQPHELERTRSLHYSLFNIEALFQLGGLGEHAGVDLYHYVTEDGRSIRKALEFLLPYVDPAKEWPYPEMDGAAAFNHAAFIPILRRAAAIYQDKRYEGAISRIPGELVHGEMSILLYPPK